MLSTRVFTPRVSWVKASVQNYDKYRSVLSYKLHNIDLPYAALLCSDFMCSKCDHKMLFRCTPKQLPMRACLLLILVSRALAILAKVVAYPGGLNRLHHSVKTPYSGTNYGLTVAAQGRGPLLRV